MPDKEKKSKLLFVDDEMDLLDGMRRMLHSKRDVWDMTFVNSVDEALTLIGSQRVDAVISDVSMPGKDGFTLLKTIRGTEATSDIPVTILTGLNDRNIKERALDMGGTDLLSKPAEPAELIARINNMLRMKSYQDEIKAHRESLEVKVRERTAELEASRIELIWQLGKAAEYRDRDTGNHVVRVGYYSHVLAETLGMDSEFSERIFFTAPLHDIGKIGIPDRILLKEGPLSDEEWVIMRGHSEIGANILRQEPRSIKVFGPVLNMKYFLNNIKTENPLLEMASAISLGHHEKWDGSGYPGGLAGEDIPLEARITAVSDVYDALFSKRPYKPRFPEERVRHEMMAAVGTHFDPEVYNAMEKAKDLFDDIRAQFADDEFSGESGVISAL